MRPCKPRDFLRVAASIMAAYALALPASGQTVSDVHAMLHSILDSGARSGSVDIADSVHQIYRELHERADRSGVEIVRDIRYGVFPRQTLDLYVPLNRGDELLPVVVFVHGGSLDDGDKAAPGAEEYLFGNVATFFARRGFVAVNANYRLVPDIVWPQGAEDLREIMGWLVTENAESWGGDPTSMFMIGVSGSARHLVSFMFHRTSQMVRLRTGLVGAVLISPWLETGTDDVLKQYYGENQERFSPLSLLESHDPAEPGVPVLLLSGALDPPDIQRSTTRLFEAMCDRYEDCPGIEQVQNHYGYSAVASFNTADESVSSVVLDFIRRLARPDADQ